MESEIEMSERERALRKELDEALDAEEASEARNVKLESQVRRLAPR